MKNKVTFASGLRPDWNSGPGDVNKENHKKQTHVQISVGGLGDSDAEAVNPFPSPKSQDDLRDIQVGEEAKLERDPSQQNDVNTTSTLSIVFSDAHHSYSWFRLP